MIKIVPVPANQGIPPQEIQRLLLEGWVVIPKVTIAAPEIATPNSPEGPTVVDLWILYPPGPTMPQVALISVLIEAWDGGAHHVTLDLIAQRLFNVNVATLRELFPEKPTEERQMPPGMEVKGPVQ